MPGKEVIHTHPRLCYMVPEELNNIHRVSHHSTNIDEVACSICIYYYFHPEAKNMERAFRDR